MPKGTKVEKVYKAVKKKEAEGMAAPRPRSMRR